MAVEEWIGRPSEEWAYTVFIKETKQAPSPDGSFIYRAYYKNCNGGGVPKEGAYKRIRTKPPPPRIDDHRTLKDWIAGCCPPELMKDYIMHEGALRERDPVEEAMKLQKRGYFGGGG